MLFCMATLDIRQWDRYCMMSKALVAIPSLAKLWLPFLDFSDGASITNSTRQEFFFFIIIFWWKLGGLATLLLFKIHYLLFFLLCAPYRVPSLLFLVLYHILEYSWSQHYINWFFIAIISCVSFHLCVLASASDYWNMLPGPFVLLTLEGFRSNHNLD